MMVEKSLEMNSDDYNILNVINSTEAQSLMVKMVSLFYVYFKTTGAHDMVS